MGASSVNWRIMCCPGLCLKNLYLLALISRIWHIPAWEWSSDNKPIIPLEVQGLDEERHHRWEVLVQFQLDGFGLHQRIEILNFFYFLPSPGVSKRKHEVLVPSATWHPSIASVYKNERATNNLKFIILVVLPVLASSWLSFFIVTVFYLTYPIRRIFVSKQKWPSEAVSSLIRNMIM